MPTFENYPTSDLIKALYLGDGGTGKTGSLCALAAAGFTVRILDLDGMAGVIRDFVTNPVSPYLKALPPHWTADMVKGVASRISYVTIQETYHAVQGRKLPKGEAWGKIVEQLGDWKDDGKSWGKPDSWGKDSILVLDGLTRLSEAAWNRQLCMNGRMAGRPEQNDYWQAQQLIDGVLGELRTLGCHVIIICHIDYIEQDNKLTRGFAKTVGKALSPKLNRDFPHILQADKTGQGDMVKRKICTTPRGMIDLRSPVPLKVKSEYELGTGLAEYFKDVLGHYGSGKA